MRRFLKYFIAVVSLLVLCSLIYLSLTDEVIGVNKTVNWAWDLSNFKYWVILITYSLFLLLMLSVFTLLILKIKDKLKANAK